MQLYIYKYWDTNYDYELCFAEADAHLHQNVSLPKRFIFIRIKKTHNPQTTNPNMQYYHRAAVIRT